MQKNKQELLKGILGDIEEVRSILKNNQDELNTDSEEQ